MQLFDYWMQSAPDEAGIRPSAVKRGFNTDLSIFGSGDAPAVPFPDGTGALAVVRESANAFLAIYAHPLRLTAVRIPEADLRALKGDLRPLVNLVRSDLDQPQALTASTRWTFEIRREALYRALEIFDSDMYQLLGLLAGAISSVGLAVTHFPASFSRRYQLIQGLMMLLPSPLRYLLTFSMNSSIDPPASLRLVFIQGDYSGSRCQAEWGQRLTVSADKMEQAYVKYLRTRWEGDLDDFVRALMALDKAAYQITAVHSDLAQALAAVIDVIAAEQDEQHLPVSAMIALLEDDSLDDEARSDYIDRLLAVALDERDAAASHWLAARMEQQPELAEKLNARLDAMLETQPDAVYAFVRAHLNAGGALAVWLPRLHRAARSAFRVVLESGDASSIMSWLQLLAREPETYEMAAIVHEAILGSIPLAYQNAGVARDLLVRAIKRDPAVLDTLLNDPQFEQALAPEIRQALYAHQPEAVASVIDQSRELFLLAIARALPLPGSISEQLAVMLWQVYAACPNLIVASDYHPLTLLRRLIGVDRHALAEGALVRLLAAVLADGRDDLVVEFVAALPAAERADALLPALRLSERTADEIVNLLTQLNSSGLLEPQSTIAIYAALLDSAGWEERYTAPFLDPLARLMAQAPEAALTDDALWHLAERAAAGRSADSTVRVVMRRLLTTVVEPQTDEALLNALLRTRKLIQNHPAARAQLMMWWMGYLERLSMQQLGQLEKLLNGQRALDDLRDSLATAISVRRLFADQDLRQWSEDIATTYRVLRALSEGFDPEQRSGSIDVATLQRLLAVAKTWPPDQRQVLAANLRDLAELLPAMADARTKPSLIRSEEQLERRLMSGELQPQSAIDIMRWLAGFLEGAQKNGL